MRKILIFGNSGSGKSTLGRELAEGEDLAHLDLDTLAWLPGVPPERALLDVSEKKIREFTETNDKWVIEGCYTDLLEMVGPEASEIIFMNLPVALCIENAKMRPWEPHKYPSKEAQDKNLEFLIDWIKQYVERTDVFSYSAHRDFYEAFERKKTMLTSNNH